MMLALGILAIGLGAILSVVVLVVVLSIREMAEHEDFELWLESDSS
jgi:hypothetical protein